MALDYDWRREAASALEWWRDAGVDTLVEAEARDWTARPAPRAAPVPETPIATAPALPDTLEAFLAWRLGDEAPEAAWGLPLIAPAGNPAADLLVLLDLPEAFDAESRTLLSGPEGRLLDRILLAIGRSRETAHVATLAAARPAAGAVPADLEPRLGELMMHFIALTGPARVLLMGQAATRAVFGPNGWSRRGSLECVNHANGTVEALATWSPRFLLEKPAAKAEAWKHLQLLIGGRAIA